MVQISLECLGPQQHSSTSPVSICLLIVEMELFLFIKYDAEVFAGWRQEEQLHLATYNHRSCPIVLPRIKCTFQWFHTGIIDLENWYRQKTVWWNPLSNQREWNLDNIQWHTSVPDSYSSKTRCVAEWLPLLGDTFQKLLQKSNRERWLTVHTFFLVTATTIAQKPKVSNTKLGKYGKMNPHYWCRVRSPSWGIHYTWCQIPNHRNYLI